MKTHSFVDKSYSSLIICVTLLGVLFRVIGIFTIPVTFDESFNFLISKSNDVYLLIKGIAEVHPPFYFLISHNWGQFSDNIHINRLLSVIFGVITIPIIAYIGKKIFGQQTGLLVALIFAISPSQIYYSSIARMYSLVVLESTLTIYLFINFLNKKKGILPLGITLLVSLYTHYFFVIYILVLNIYFFANLKLTKHLVKLWTSMICVIFVLFIPALFIFFSTKPSIPVPVNSLLKLPVFYIIPQLPWEAIQISSIFRYNQLDFTSFIAILIATTSIILLMIGISKKNLRNQMRPLLFIYIISPIIILTISYQLTRIAALRSFILFSPIFFLIIAKVITDLPSKIRLSIIFFLTILLSIYCFNNIFYPPNEPKEITNYFKSGDVIVYNDITFYLPITLQKPNGTHLLLFSSHLQENAYKAINVRITKISEIPKTTKIWFVKQKTQWPPYDKEADNIEKYLHTKFKEVNRMYFYKLELIEYQLNYDTA